ALFTTPGYGADSGRHAIVDRAADIPTLRRLYALAPQGPDAAGFHLPDGAVAYPDRAQAPAAMPAPDLNPDKVAYLAFTSGTTGAPKGVMHSDNTLLANGRALVADWRHTSDTILLTLSP